MEDVVNGRRSLKELNCLKPRFVKIDDISDAHLVYLRKADDIDQRTMKDELDDYLQTMILLQYPKATENIEVINGWSGRFFEMPATADPEKVFFMYHDQTGRVRAVVNHTTGIVGLSYSSDPSGKLIIDQDLDELVNGSYMSLNLNQDKQLFQKSKQMLLKELAQRTSAIDKDFEKYLHQAEEL